MKNPYVKAQAAKDAAEVWQFAPTGDPDLDLFIAASLSDLENNPDIMGEGSDIMGEGSDTMTAKKQ